MKANELRIGNYVKVSTPAITCDNFRVDAILGADSEYAIRYYPMAENYYFYFEGFLLHAEPIPITPELLERCGFDVHPYDDGSGNGKTAEYGSISLDKGNNWEYWNYYHSGGDFEINIVDIDIKYLHQLQNLYYALTGEELTVKWN